MNGRPESGSMSRAIFSLLTFQGSSASCLFILHDLISVAGDDESPMNPGLRLCIEFPRRGILGNCLPSREISSGIHCCLLL
jgi:hypothetical protein